MGFGNESYESDWEDDDSNNILIYGGPKVGKTTLASLMIKKQFDGDPKCLAFIINTDKGFTKPAKFVGLGDPKYKGRIKYFYVNTIQRAIDVMNEIRTTVEERQNPNDVVLFDLLSWSWDEAQKQFVNELSGGEVVGYIAKAMKDPKKFGQFEGMQWGYIKKAEDMVTNYLTRNPICKVIALARVKDPTISYKLAGKKVDIWCHVGIPDGRKDLMHEFNTVVRVDKYKDGEDIKRKFIVMASRDGDPDYKWYAFTTPDSFVKQIEKLEGGMKVKEKPLKDDTPSDKEVTQEVVECIKETFGDEQSFTMEDIVDACGNPDIVSTILEQAVKAGKIFCDDNGSYSFDEPKETKKEVSEDREYTEEEIKRAEAIIFEQYDHEKKVADANVVIQTYVDENLAIDMDEGVYLVDTLVEKGLLVEPTIGVLKLVNEPELPEEEEATDDEPKEDKKEELQSTESDGWLS